MNQNWKIFAQRTNKIEKKYLTLLIDVISNYRSSFISEYRIHGQAAYSRLPPVNTEIARILTDLYKEAGLMGAQLSYAEIKRAAKQKDASFGRNDTWIQSVLNYLKLNLLKFITRISETMRSDINNILQRSIDNGWGIDQTVEELKNKGLIEARARTIARTEVIRAANVGHSIGAQSLPYEVDKKWIAAQDHRTRHSHSMTNGHTTDEYGSFKVPVFKGDEQIGVDEMQFPGDPNAHPSNTINCRCRVIYVPKRDAQGKLILRRSTSATIIPMQARTYQTPAQQIAAALKANIRFIIGEGNETE